MKILFAVLILLIPGFAQTPLKPTSFALSTDPTEGVFPDALWRELRQNRNLIVTSRKPDFDIYVVMTELKEDQRSYGYAAAVLVVTKEKYNLSMHTGRGPELLARHIAAKLEKEYFNSPPERVK